MRASHIVAIIVLLMAFAAGGVVYLFWGGEKPWVSRAPKKSESVVRIVSFNVEGLFDPTDDPQLTGLNDDVPTDEFHLGAIATTIHDLNADILALQSVESLAALEWFNETYLASLGYEHMASIDVGHARGIENAVLSRFPISEQRVWPHAELSGTHPPSLSDRPNPWSGKPMTFKRSPLLATIDIPNQVPLTLFVVEHKGGDRFGYWREAEAEEIVERCRAIGLSRRIIVLGSFHCEPGDQALKPYINAGFTDPVGSDGNSEFFATEVSGDRTDFILANRAIGRDLDPSTGFVLGGSLADLMRSGELEMSHLPVVVGLQAADD